METFWVAVGSIGAVVAAIAALIPFLGPLRKRLSRREQRRIVAQVKESADRFHYWIQNFYHHGELSDQQRLVDWLVADEGHAKVSDDYRVFVKVAELLQQRRYKTFPPPTEAEFNSALSKAKQRRA